METVYAVLEEIIEVVNNRNFLQRKSSGKVKRLANKKEEPGVEVSEEDLMMSVLHVFILEWKSAKSREVNAPQYYHPGKLSSTRTIEDQLGALQPKWADILERAKVFFTRSEQYVDTTMVTENINQVPRKRSIWLHASVLMSEASLFSPFHKKVKAPNQ